MAQEVTQQEQVVTGPILTNRVNKLRSNPLVAKQIQRQAAKTKFTKDQAYYVGKSLTFLGLCQNCLWFLPAPSPEKPSLCTVVSEQGEPTPGIISPTGTSGLWNASPARILTYEKAYGRGPEQKGTAPQIIRKRVISMRRGLEKGRKVGPPEEVPPTPAAEEGY